MIFVSTAPFSNLNATKDCDNSFFVASVEQGSVMKTAKSMSLVAKNAHVIATCVREKAASFQAIIDFSDELANNTMHLVKIISEFALETSATAVDILHQTPVLLSYWVLSLKSKRGDKS